MRQSTAIAAVLACAMSVPASAEEGGDASGTFGLGQILVEGTQEDELGISLDTLDAEAMRTFQLQTLDDAVRLMPGVTVSTGGDTNTEWQLSYATGVTEPHQTSREETYSLAAENQLQQTPTLAERFRSRFGGAVSNPDLKAERATHYEVGARRRF
ncbi:Plug domain-containing protein [Novosphingobium profundi]|uniref:Plug domain-containing protein n=1 Tax=Novosphingobium profundi TaxID=1774954 RepID=UPI001CFCB6DF|nr:Plug domain-containing protein [Novosphingobium profundi]